MSKTLGRKQNLTNEDWTDLISNIENVISRAEVEQLSTRTIESIKSATNERNAAYAWSGGKDSLVLQKLCELADVTQCFIAITELEYPEFINWIRIFGPEELEYVHTGQDINWLSKNLNFLFPQDNKILAKWWPIVQWSGQRKYYEAQKLDLLMLGRRRIEGNYLGPNGGAEYSTKDGRNIFNPVADWSHEQIYGFIHYHGLGLPPIYYYKNGFRRGTHPWPIRKWTGSVENGWREIYDIDPQIIQHAAPHIESARSFLKGVAAA